MKKLKIIGVILMALTFRTGMAQCVDDAYTNYSYCLGEISIEGSTNVNHFSFSYENPVMTKNTSALASNICYHEPTGTNRMDFDIPLNSFKGSNPAMRNDFLDLLKAGIYPDVTVGINKNEFDCIASGSPSEKIDLEVMLAGVKKSVQANYTTFRDTENRIVLSGITNFLLSDFHLEPPEKALGLIRVRNEVFIKFDIVIQNASSINQALN